MSKRGDVFQEQAEKYADDVWKEDEGIEQKCITMTDYFAGADYGYQYAVEKAVEFLKEKEFGDWIEQEASSFIEDFRKAMQ